jgi:hypothetical protein
MTTKPIYYLNASLEKGSGGCRRKIFWQGYHGMRSSPPANDIVFGSAIHVFKAEMLCNGGNYRLGLEAAINYFNGSKMYVKPNKQWMTTARLTQICCFYWEIVGSKSDFKAYADPRDPTGMKKLVEQTFDIPVYDCDLFEIHVCGTIDQLGRFNYGLPGICDLKTTSTWDADSFLSAFGQTIQLKLYIWALRQKAKKALESGHPNNIISKMCEGQLCAFIDGIFLHPTNVPTFKESDKFVFTNEIMQEFEHMLMAEVREYANDIHMYLQFKFEPRPTGVMFDSCSTKYGLCEFFPVCNAPDKQAFDILKESYHKQKYEPLQFRQLDKIEIGESTTV